MNIHFWHMPQGDLTLDELCDTLVIHLRSKQSFLAAWLASVVAIEIFSLP